MCDVIEFEHVRNGGSDFINVCYSCRWIKVYGPEKIPFPESEKKLLLCPLQPGRAGVSIELVLKVKKGVLVK